MLNGRAILTSVSFLYLYGVRTITVQLQFDCQFAKISEIMVGTLVKENKT